MHTPAPDPVSVAALPCRGVVQGSIWSVHTSPVSGHVAYAAESGQVVVAPPYFQHKIRNAKPPHIVISCKKPLLHILHRYTYCDSG